MIVFLLLSAFLIVSLPFYIVASLFYLTTPSVGILPVILIAPWLFLFSYAFTAGLLSRIGIKAIVRGTFPRDLRHPIYGRRRIYGLCWNAIYYFTPLYFFCLSFPKIRKILFSLFGYKGSNNISIFPDAWLRDLPLLNFGDKAYIANRATIGTNMCLSNGKILVDEISIGKNAMVGHLSLVGPGSVMENKTELGVHTALGIRARLQEGSKTGICVTIFHAVDVGIKTEIGACSYIGLRVKLGPNIKVPAGSNIPSGTVINNQEDMNKYYSAETQTLNAERMKATRTVLRTVEIEGELDETS